MKSLKSLHTKEIIDWTKGLNLLTSVDTRTNLLFYDMIARIKIYNFTVIFLAAFPLEPVLCLGGLCFALCFPKQKSRSSDGRFHWRMLWGIFPVKATRNWRHLFVWILIHCNLFVICYIFWLKITVRNETLNIKT